MSQAFASTSFLAGKAAFVTGGSRGIGAAIVRRVAADGPAVVVHAYADDYQTDPSGNSGSRIACGVVSR